jgi:hypothetical protein
VEMCWVTLGNVKVVVIGEGAAGRMVIEGEAYEDDEAAEDGVVIANWDWDWDRRSCPFEALIP